MADYYRLGHREPRRRKRRLGLLLAILLMIVLVIRLGFVIRRDLKPKTTITKSKAVTTRVNYDTKTKRYEQPDFSIDILASWKPLPRPPGPYQSFTLSSGDVGGAAQEIEIYQDVIPVNFAVNRVLVVEGQVDHLQVIGAPSDNCTTFTNNLAGAPNQAGTPAKWQDISFLCDRANQTRDVIGTSSKDGVNTVILKNQSTGKDHKYFFTYTNHSLNPDYAVFSNALNSLRMR